MADELPLTRCVPRLTADAALRLIGAAAQQASATQLAVAIVVVGDLGQELATLCLDGAGPQALGVARKKAYSAVAYRRPTDEFFAEAHERFGSDGVAMLSSAVEGTMLLGGGVPVFVDGALVGAIGVSGGRGEQDKAIAVAAISTVIRLGLDA